MRIPGIGDDDPTLMADADAGDSKSRAVPAYRLRPLVELLEGLDDAHCVGGRAVATDPRY